ncbi:unnamed protein product [Lepeophtheirus salmonis]|uniref:(salmon louse) hypothetical protein n=1 Tax=Lepeophtheirus salmonis TaxID=72036 RepID=A0A7R8D466_LEPSM|nr:unnamed protein product [Lepeophtheirus salmonis]CAF2992738.1 unnamed protein product [Lepeophtheirus salmonis]
MSENNQNRIKDLVNEETIQLKNGDNKLGNRKTMEVDTNKRPTFNENGRHVVNNEFKGNRGIHAKKSIVSESRESCIALKASIVRECALIDSAEIVRSRRSFLRRIEIFVTGNGE